MPVEPARVGGLQEVARMPQCLEGILPDRGVQPEQWSPARLVSSTPVNKGSYELDALLRRAYLDEVQISKDGAKQIKQ